MGEIITIERESQLVKIIIQLVITSTKCVLQNALK